MKVPPARRPALLPDWLIAPRHPALLAAPGQQVCGHLFPLDKPRATAAAIRTFLH